MSLVYCILYIVFYTLGYMILYIVFMIGNGTIYSRGEPRADTPRVWEGLGLWVPPVASCGARLGAFPVGSGEGVYSGIFGEKRGSL